MQNLVRDPQDSAPVILELRHRLDEFYATTTTYTAFEQPVDQSQWFALFRPQMAQLLASKTRISILEVGAGRSVFGTFAGDLRNRIAYHAQDVTATNYQHLIAHADNVHISDLQAVPGMFDLIFHTFVLEHVSAPRQFLEQINARLLPGGYHVVICPRYDLPGYICPSMRHLPRMKRMIHTTFLAGSRVMSRLDGQSRFWVNTDPALLHRPWYRDADAVHLVGRFDVEQWHRQNGFKVDNLESAHSARRPWLQRKITLAIACQKKASIGTGH